MTYAMTALLFACLALAAAIATVAHVERALRGMTIRLTSEF